MPGFINRNLESIERAKRHTHNGVDSPFIDLFSQKGFPVLAVAPTTKELREGQIVWVDDGGGTLRGYTVLNGSLRYWDLT